MDTETFFYETFGMEMGHHKMDPSFDEKFICDAVDRIKSLENTGIVAIVGRSGTGKSTLLKNFHVVDGKCLKNDARILFDAIMQHCNVDHNGAAKQLQQVSINSLWDWMKPINTLSDGQRFRAFLCMYLEDGCAVDEFCSELDFDHAVSVCAGLSREDCPYKNLILSILDRRLLEHLNWDLLVDLDRKTMQEAEEVRPERPSRKRRLPSLTKAVKAAKIVQITERNQVVPMWNKTFAAHHYISKKCVGFFTHAFLCYSSHSLTPDEPIAMMVVMRLPSAQVSNKNALRIHRMVVLPPFQGRGLGKHFLDSVAQILQEKEGATLFLKTRHPAIGKHCEKSHKWSPTTTNGCVGERTWYNSQNKKNITLPYYCYYWDP